MFSIFRIILILLIFASACFTYLSVEATISSSINPTNINGPTSSIVSSASAHVPSMTYVIKRNGTREPVMFDKITRRITAMCYNLDLNYIDPVVVAQGASFPL